MTFKPLDKILIQKKMATIKEYLREALPILPFPSRQIIDDYMKLRTIERDFQLIVDAMIEINTHIIARNNLPPADDYTNTFFRLGEYKILPIDFAAHIAKVVNLRNRIVHDYDNVDKKLFIDQLKVGVGDFEKYLKYIGRLVK